MEILGHVAQEPLATARVQDVDKELITHFNASTANGIALFKEKNTCVRDVFDKVKWSRQEMRKKALKRF